MEKNSAHKIQIISLSIFAKASAPEKNYCLNPPPYTYKSSHWSGPWEGKPYNSRGIKSPIIFGITKGNKRHYIGVKLLTYFSNKCLNCAEDVDTGEEAF